MTPIPTLSKIKKLVVQGRLKKALELFIVWAEEHQSTHEKAIEVHSSTFSHNEVAHREGTLLGDSYNAARAKTTKALLDLISLCEKEGSSSEDTRLITLKPHHQYTCDRISQVRDFTHLEKEDKIHFLYLYGGDMHAHSGCVHRIAFSLDGRDKDHLSPKASSRKTIVKSFSFATLEDEEEDKKELIKRLLLEFDIEVNNQDGILGRDLSYILDNSPNLKGMDGNDNVCVMITISEDDWDKEDTPRLVLWFIKHFCQVTLSEHQPTLYFFFAIEYYEEDEEVVNEVEAVVRSASYLRPLPKLDMVTYKDIRRWFNDKYRKVEENAGIRRVKLEECFGKNGDFYMSDIQTKLKKIIDEINNDNLIK